MKILRQMTRRVTCVWDQKAPTANRNKVHAPPTPPPPHPQTFPPSELELKAAADAPLGLWQLRITRGGGAD